MVMLEVLFEQFMLVKVFVVDNVKAIENSGEEGSQAFLLLFLRDRKSTPSELQSH